MRRKVIWLSAAAVTFIVGVASVLVWLRFSNTQSASQEPPVKTQAVRGLERMRACLKRFDIRLGDSFQHVDALIPISHNPNGPNQNTAGPEGAYTDFMSFGQPLIALDDENELFTAIYCAFDEDNRLRSFKINWSVSYVEESESLKRKMMDTLLTRDLTCINLEEIDFKKGTHKVESDGGDYVQEFEYNFRAGHAYWASYSVEMK
jgi:hypothetical protein